MHVRPFFATLPPRDCLADPVSYLCSRTSTNWQIAAKMRPIQDGKKGQDRLYRTARVYGKLPKRVKGCTVPTPADRRWSDEQKVPRDSSSKSRSFSKLYAGASRSSNTPSPYQTFCARRRETIEGTLPNQAAFRLNCVLFLLTLICCVGQCRVPS